MHTNVDMLAYTCGDVVRYIPGTSYAENIRRLRQELYVWKNGVCVCLTDGAPQMKLTENC